MHSERRSSPRVPVSVTVTYRVDGHEREGTYRVESVNVSEGGVFVATDVPLGLGTEVHLEFHLPNQSESIQASGRIVWYGRAETAGGGMVLGKGIQFTDCTERCRQHLATYVAQYQRS